jgi:hypothetical protein
VDITEPQPLPIEDFVDQIDSRGGYFYGIAESLDDFMEEFSHIDAYARAAELDPSNVAIVQHLQPLKNAQATGSQLPAAPGPQDVPLPANLQVASRPLHHLEVDPHHP